MLVFNHADGHFNNAAYMAQYRALQEERRIAANAQANITEGLIQGGDLDGVDAVVGHHHRVAEHVVDGGRTVAVDLDRVRGCVLGAGGGRSDQRHQAHQQCRHRQGNPSASAWGMKHGCGVSGG